MKLKNLMVAAALVSLVACGGDDDMQGMEPLNNQQPNTSQQEAGEAARAAWPEGLAEKVDSANAAYSQKRYGDAAATYTELTQQYPDNGTLWFGLYMAEKAQGNEEAAAAAMKKVEELSPGLAPMHDMMTSGQHPDISGGAMPPAGGDTSGG